MAEPHVIAALKERRARVSGQILALEARIGQHRADLLHLDATLRLFDAAIEPDAILPKRPAPRNDWFGHGECLRLAYSVLRGAPEPVPTGDIVRRLMAIKGQPVDDRATMTLMRQTIFNSLDRAKNTVERVPGAGRELCWRLRD
ncbi:MAG: hypothetical protein WCF85_22370 [Rhodospirillaceae bacterium]